MLNNDFALIYVLKLSSMKNQFNILKSNRELILKIADHYSLEQLNTVPDGFKNNLVWNMAHLVVTQQLLVYRMSNLPTLVSDEMIEKYKKGTKTESVVEQAEYDAIKELMLSTVTQTQLDFEKGLFQSYNEYTTSTGFVIQSAADAMEFNSYHEGIHLGYILAMKKLV